MKYYGFARSDTNLKGVWVYQTDDEHTPRWVCSNCGRVVKRDPYDDRYCPRCGAAMRKQA